MLLTFSRRAAAEMMRRVERIVAKVMHERAEAMTDAIVWAGTFHAIGARLLREYADAMVKAANSLDHGVHLGCSPSNAG